MNYLPRTFTRVTYQFPHRKFIPRSRVTSRSITSTLSLIDKISFKKVHFPKKNSVFTEILSSSFSPDGQTEIDILESSFDFDIYYSRSLSDSLTITQDALLTIVYPRDISSTLNLNDDVVFSLHTNINHSLSLSNLIINNQILNRSLSDTLIITPSISYSKGGDALITQSLTLTQTITNYTIHFSSVNQPLTLIQSLFDVEIFNRSLSSSLSLSQSLHTSSVYTITNTLTLSQALSAASRKLVSHNLILTQTVSKISSTRLTINDLLTLTQKIKNTNNLQITFETSNQVLSLPAPDTFVTYPYFSLNIPVYGTIDTSLYNPLDYTNVTLFRAQFALSKIERNQLYKYLNYWRYNKFNIRIQNDLWLGYLTTDNFFDMQTENPNVQINFEACLVGRG